MKRLKITESITINSSAETVFDHTQNYEQRLSWDTFLNKAELIDTNTPAVGVKAWCVSKHGLGVETEYVSFNRPKVTAVKQSKRSLLFEAFSGSWKFQPRKTNQTKVIFTYSFTLNIPFSWFGKLIFVGLKSNVQQRLKDLKQVVENRSSLY